MILYLETNFVLGVSSGQEARAEELFRIPAHELTIAMPDICVMEALTATRNKVNLGNRFEQEMDTRITDVERSATSHHVASLTALLQQARIENRNILNDLMRRQNIVLEQAALPNSGLPRIMLLPLTPAALRESLANDYVPGANDNLILSVILNHARGTADEKVLLTANTRDFHNQDIQPVLNAAGVFPIFSRTEAFLGRFSTR